MQTHPCQMHTKCHNQIGKEKNGAEVEHSTKNHACCGGLQQEVEMKKTNEMTSQNSWTN